MDELAMAARLREFLGTAGLAEVSSSLRHSRAREESIVWTASLVHPAGDAQLEAFVFDLAADPSRRIDAEEEKVALLELDHPLVPELLASHIDAEFAVLLVADCPGAAVVRRYLAERAEPVAEHGARSLTYRPDIDRLVGNDVSFETAGRFVVQWWMSRSRAAALFPVLGAFARAAGGLGQDDPCVPLPMAVVEPEADVGVVHGPDQIPAEYDDIVFMVCRISPVPTLNLSDGPWLPGDPEPFARRLFTTLRVAHALPAALSRAQGCSVGPFSVTPAGHLRDAYFLTGGSELAEPELAQLQVRDIANAALILRSAAGEDVGRKARQGFNRAVQAGVAAYLPEAVRSVRRWLSLEPGRMDDHLPLWRFATALHNARR